MKHHPDPINPSDSRSELGIVYRKSQGSCGVRVDGRTVICSFTARALPSDKSTNSKPKRKRSASYEAHGDVAAIPVVGDWVRIQDLGWNSAAILELLPRKNQLARRSAVPMPSAHASEQVIAANLDQVVAVFSIANPTPKWGLLDRYLVSAESSEIPALICINKIDLEQTMPQESELSQVVEIYRRIGYPVVLVSARTGQGLDDLAAALQGRISSLLGKSGVGKTTLLNALQPGLDLRVNEISSATGKGRHTTTQLEMFELDLGGAVIDTPGVREFGLWGVDGRDLAWFFPEMRPRLGSCRFGLDCRHDEEPGCAIRAGVVAGEISPYRYRSYIRLKEET